jgi:hypothetical protein
MEHPLHFQHEIDEKRAKSEKYLESAPKYSTFATSTRSYLKGHEAASQRPRGGTSKATSACLDESLLFSAMQSMAT